MEAAQDIDRAATELTTGTADEGNPACSETPAPKAACEGTSRSDGAGPQHDVEDVGESSDERREAKGAGEGAKAAAEEEHANSGDGREEGDRPTKKFSPEASLYCQVNGRSHAILLDFDYDDCPLCQQDLMSPENPDFQPAKLSGGKPDPKTSVVPDVSYLVEYRNRRNEFIHQEPWEGAFDLSTARKDVEQSDTSVFRLVTVLSTSIQPEVWHMPENKLNKSKSILKTPNIAISVYTTRLTIHSLSLIQLLRRFVPYYPSVNLNSGVLELEEPFALIGHYYEELEAYRTAHRNMRVADDQIAHGKGDDNEDTASVRHLGTLLDHFQKVMLRRIREEETLHGQNFCTFRMLWLLYKPGSTVYLGSGGRLSAFVVQSVTTDPAIMTTVAPDLPKPYVISVWNLAYDGRYVGRTGKTVAIAPFEGERKIASLRVIPCEFIDNEDGGQTRRGLEENGRRWYGLLPGGQAYYSGPLLNSTKRKDDEVAAADYAYNETLHGRVYVDPASFYTYEPDKAPERNEIHDFGENPVVQRLSRLGAPPPHPATLPASGPLAKCQCEECHGRRPHPPHGFPWTNYDILDPAVEKDLTLPGGRDGPLHRYLLCDRLLHGFDLKSRTWVQLDVSHCGRLQMNETAIDRLVMSSERKDMIKALVQKFTNGEGSKGPQRSWAADFIENKGEGQIFLLHGSPGVGKTYVKCIAEYTGRPLLSLTCGDIGTNQEKMERGLSKWFRLAEKWGAVMLIDEADVYLERRMASDLKRNSLVSVFLRCIEYYRGILFLTTNRVGHFDDAFMSRIHVVIRYDNLSEESRKQIWQQFFNKLDNEREDFKTTQRAKDYVLEDGEISTMEWNGREIRNAFQTAVSLAEFRFQQGQGSSRQKQPTLDQKDFEWVCNMMKQFKNYMTNVHGMDEEERAFNLKSRASRST